MPHLARSFEATWGWYQTFWDYEPERPVSMFLEDFGDWGNGGATAVPRNFVYVSMAPSLYVFDVMPVAERMTQLMHHELTHVIAMDQAAHRDRLWRRVFGGKVQQVQDDPPSLLWAFLTVPRKFSPRWFHEGLAVNMETWTGAGIGRAMGAYDEMVFRAMVRDSTRIYHMVGLESEGTAIDFQVGANSYLYGARFFSYLAGEYGPDKLIEWGGREEGEARYFSREFRSIYGTPLPRERSRWIRFEEEWQEANLERIRQHPVTHPRRITSRALGSISRPVYDEARNRIYVGIKYPGRLAHLTRIDPATGEETPLAEIKGAGTYATTSLAHAPDLDLLFFTTDNRRYRDLNSLDLATERTELLIRDLRAGALAYNRADGSLWGVRHENGISTLTRIEPPYRDWEAIHAFTYGTHVYDLDIDPSGTHLSAVVTRVDGSQDMALFELEQLREGDAGYRNLYDFQGSTPSSFLFGPHGRYLYGSSYYSGVSNIFRVEVATGNAEILSNAETGLFRPLPLEADSLLVFEYVGGGGWLPGWIADEPVENVAAIHFLGQRVYDRFPEVAEWTPPNPATVDLDSVHGRTDPYRPLFSLDPHSRYPILEGYRGYASPGIRMDFGDITGLHALSVKASYSPSGDALDTSERLHLGLDWRFWRWTLRAAYNPAGFYDLFGPRREARKGWHVELGRSHTLVFDPPRTMEVEGSLSFFSGLDRLPEYQNIGEGIDAFSRLKLGWTYEFVERSQGAVEDEKGWRLGVGASLFQQGDRVLPRVQGSMDLGWPVTEHHASVWLHTRAGIGADELLSSFYFGGFLNNWVDYREEKRYRTLSSFPGLAIDQAGGGAFLKEILELNLPPLRFREVGWTGLYARWLRPSLFASFLSTRSSLSSAPEAWWNAGIQVDLRLITLSLMEMTLSGGYAVAFDGNDRVGDGGMVSLKIF